MKSLLMIAYTFPPEGNAGAYRPLRFARHLGEYGWRADVITCDGERQERHDPNLLQQVPADCSIFRVGYFDPWERIQKWRAQRSLERGQESNGGQDGRPVTHNTRSSPLRSRLREAARRVESLSYHPDLRMFWIRPAVEAGLRAARHHSYSAIWATGAPWSSFVVAQRISERAGIPYVLDFRSSWTLVPNDFERRRPEWLQRRDRKKLARLFEGARSVVFFYEREAECFWQVYRSYLDVSKIHIIPNGFDGKVDRDRQLPERSDRCRILYTGVLSSYRYETLLQALAALKKRYPERAARLLFEFVGEGNEALQSYAAALGVDDLVNVSPPVPHSEVRSLERHCHALLMLGRGPEHIGFELLAGAKLFGYLKASRPILGVLPDDEAKRILSEVGVTTVASADFPSQIAAMLDRFLQAWEEERLGSLLPDREACETFSASRQTADLVRALEGRSSSTPFMPGRSTVPPSLKERVSTQPLPGVFPGFSSSVRGAGRSGVIARNAGIFARPVFAREREKVDSSSPSSERD